MSDRQRALTPDECERLWDAFEKVDAAAAHVAYAGGYVRAPALITLRNALDSYRSLRDELTEARTVDPEPEDGGRG